MRVASDDPDHVDILLSALSTRGVECVNLVANDRLRTDVAPHHGYTVVKTASFGVKLRTALSPALIAHALRMHGQQPFDLVHAHFPDPLTHLALSLLPKHLPKVISWHSDLVPFSALQRVYQPMVNATLRSASAIVGATPAHLNTPQIPADIAAHRKHVIPYGMDFGRFEPTPELMQHASLIQQSFLGYPVVFSLGRHVGYKGFDVLLRAMVHLPQARLVLGGTGPLLAQHQTLARELGLTERVRFPGRIADADLPAWYHACDVFCLPSVGLTEGFGLVQLEAMACGKPVVCSALGNGVNYVHRNNETGFSVPVGDPAALAKALRVLLYSPQLARQMGLAGRAVATQQYSLDAMARPMQALYASLAA